MLHSLAQTQTLPYGLEQRYCREWHSLAQEFRSSVRNRIDGGKQNHVGAMYVATHDRLPLVSDQSGDRRLGITEVSCKRGKTVPQNVRGNIGRQSRELSDSWPEFLKMQ